MHETIGVLAQYGNVIVDHIMYYEKWPEHLTKALESYKIYFVRVDLATEKLLEREDNRRKCDPRISLHYKEKVHENMIYDFEIDTGQLEPLQASMMLNKYISENEPMAIQRMLGIYADAKIKPNEL